MNHCRLIYRSSAVPELLRLDDVRQLARESAQRNEAKNITGMLMLSGNDFLQVLEGPTDTVNELYAKILSDKRHKQVRLIVYEPMMDRIYPDWGMRAVFMSSFPEDVVLQMQNKYGIFEGAVQIPSDPFYAKTLLFEIKHLSARRD